MFGARRALVGVAVAGVAVLTLTGCKSIDASAHCDETDGKWVCTSVVTPDVPPTSTVPPTTSPTKPPVTTVPPPTTTVPPTSPPVTTPPTTPPVVVPPVTGSASAAERFGWGTPLTQSDEFNYTGSPTASKWGLYNGPGHAGNGRRVAGLNTVQDGFLRQTGKTNGDSAGMASKLDQKYGKVEARVRFAGSGTGNRYHPVLLQWTDAYPYPSGGELDWLENNVGDTKPEAYIHHPTKSGTVQDHFVGPTVDFTQWHNVAMTWSPTEIAGYVDGVKWFSDVKPAAQPPGPMHGTIQLDNFFGSNMQAATFDVDWYRIYR